jgi:hypothetical protein
MDYNMYRLQSSMVPVDTQALKYRKLLSYYGGYLHSITLGFLNSLSLSVSLWHTQRHVPFFVAFATQCYYKTERGATSRNVRFQEKKQFKVLSINCISLFAYIPELRMCRCKLILIRFLYEGEFFVAFIQIWQKYFLLARLCRDTAEFVRSRPRGSNCFPL